MNRHSPFTSHYHLFTYHCIVRQFFADLFFDFASPFARQPRPQKSVEQIGQNKHCRHPLVIHDREDEDKTDDKKTRNRFFRLPSQRLESLLLEPTEHHKSTK